MSESDLKPFLESHSMGATNVWENFSSCGGSIEASFGERPYINVIFEIEQLDAKDISEIADGIHFRKMPPPELLIKNGSGIKVISDPMFDSKMGKWIIKVKQIN